MSQPQLPPKPRSRLFDFFFGTEHSRETRETIELYSRVFQLHAKSEIGQGAAGPFDMAFSFCSSFIERVPTPLTADFLAAVRDIVALEERMFVLPQVADFDRLSMKEAVDLRTFLRSKEWFHLNEPKVLDLLHRAIHTVFGTIAEAIPDVSEQSLFTIPVIYTVQEPRDLVDEVSAIVNKDACIDAGLFARIRERVCNNYCAVSDIRPDMMSTKTIKRATKNNAPLNEIVKSYLGGTPFADFFMSPVPLKLGDEEFFQQGRGTLIVPLPAGDVGETGE